LKWDQPPEGKTPLFDVLKTIGLLMLLKSTAKKNRFGPPGKIRYTFSLVDWAKRPDVQAAWAEIAKRDGITADPFKDLERVWSPTHLALVTPWAMSVRFVLPTPAFLESRTDTMHAEWIKRGKWGGMDMWTR
jgi:hypothetical protein